MEHEPGTPSQESLTVKTVKGSAYTITASAATLVLGLGRSILMARLLVPDDFGLVALAMTFLHLTTPLRDFGFDYALVHRKADDTSPDEFLSVHFSLRLVQICLFVLLLLVAAPVLYCFYPQKPLLVPVLLGLTLGEIAVALGSTQLAYLRKEMRFMELSVLQVLTSLTMTVVGPLMAWRGWKAWAIVSEQISGVIVATLVVWIFIRPWRTRWRFNWKTAKWYLNYGKFIFVTQVIEPLTNQFDEFWIGTILGVLPLGFYSKAYEFAHYPSRIVSAPIAEVIFSTFAKVQDDRVRLSKAYYRTASLVIRFGFLIIGTFVLGAYEFVLIFLGAKWSPMVPIFQLMAVYTLLLPFTSITGKLINATGHPEYGSQMKIVQAIFFVPAVILGCHWWGITGVAIATDLMLLLGLLVLLNRTRSLVDISFRRMLLWPTVALLVGVAISWSTSLLLATEGFPKLAIKVACYALCYCSSLMLIEHEDYSQYLDILRNIFRTHYQGRVR